MSKILITTPDYPPRRIGGISTFVLNLESVLNQMNLKYEVFIWKKPSDVKNLDLSKFDLVFNAHFHCLIFLSHPNMMTFIHGGELLSYSKNPLKRLLKYFAHKKILSSLEKSKKNVFISEFTLNLYKNLGGTVDYSRDIVFHNCINTTNSEYIEKDLDRDIILCCFVRDVPHKNIKGVLDTFEKIKKEHSHKVSLYITANCEGDGIHDISNCSNEEREEILKKAHLNLLLSLDHTHLGNIEGFGLTVLEAGKYGVPTLGLSNGGLVESIHHKVTGLLIDNTENLYADLQYHYHNMSKNVYKHTVGSHSLVELKRMLKALNE